MRKRKEINLPEQSQLFQISIFDAIAESQANVAEHQEPVGPATEGQTNRETMHSSPQSADKEGDREG
jgi:hypothetical protein